MEAAGKGNVNTSCSHHSKMGCGEREKMEIRGYRDGQVFLECSVFGQREEKGALITEAKVRK